MDTEERKPRSLVLCFDGSASKYDTKNTNVVKLFALLKKDCEEQLTYYQAGIGTWFQPGVVSPIFEWGAKILDLAFAWYLDAHVLEGYNFLMQNYNLGDKIYIFGFSRGAYTARALAGLLYKVGILPRDNISQVSFGYDLYKRTDAEGLRLCAGFKQTYCQAVTIEFMGVWDTVSSVGVLSSRTLPFTNSNSAIRVFRHALSLDEHRTKFRPNYYHRSAPRPPATKLDLEHATSMKASSSSTPSVTEQAEVEKKKRKFWSFLRSNSKQVKQSYAMGAEEPEDVMEVWFSGCHSDVGGGVLSNDIKQSLANITLRWMVRQVIASGYGVIFDPSALLCANISLDSDPVTSEPADATDALEPLHDELQIDILWRLLEIFPFPYSWQDGNCVWHKTYMPNLGSGRQILDPHPMMHNTVKERIESQLKYKPKAKWTPNSEVYVQ
ncbi:hypothetical protein BYT27DRAFT_7120961 [Phlegmacium glaucopus]|nr:hypothetical protein BYT27DRAFT_7120961 [Phlegmacium glaucopus]